MQTLYRDAFLFRHLWSKWCYSSCCGDSFYLDYCEEEETLNLTCGTCRMVNERIAITPPLLSVEYEWKSGYRYEDGKLVFYFAPQIGTQEWLDYLNGPGKLVVRFQPKWRPFGLVRRLLKL